MNKHVSLTGDGLYALICPYHSNYMKTLLTVRDLKANGVEINYSPRDMEEILSFLDNEVKPNTAVLDILPYQYSGGTIPRNIAARNSKCPFLQMYVGMNYVNFECLRSDIETAPQKHGLVEAMIN